MEILEFEHSPALIAASLVVILIASATGFTLTTELSKKTILQQKIAISLGSVAFGGGIWSMHFVAMLGLELPILFYYDAAITLASALLAILMAAVSLMLLHFTERSKKKILISGAILGFGVLIMHYVGMTGMQLCKPQYSFVWVLVTSIVAILLCTAAISIAYTNSSNATFLVGTLCFGIAVFLTHFLAMHGTTFTVENTITEFGPSMSNETLAIGVVFSSFIIFGAFLWAGVTFLVPPQNSDDDLAKPIQNNFFGKQEIVPCEQEGGKIFIKSGDIAFIRADGHYTQVYTNGQRYFCVWPITAASKRLIKIGFIRTHRSYIVNPLMVSKFEINKETGRCIFEDQNIPPVPVSRSNLKNVRKSLS